MEKKSLTNRTAFPSKKNKYMEKQKNFYKNLRIKIINRALYNTVFMIVNFFL